MKKDYKTKTVIFPFLKHYSEYIYLFVLSMGGTTDYIS